MIWIPLQFILMYHCISCTAWSITSDSYVDPVSLMNMTQEISKMFKYYNYPKSESEKINIMKNMIIRMAVYDIPLINFDNWGKIFLTSTEDLQISKRNPDVFKYNLNDIMIKIDSQYNRYKLYASKLKGQSNNEIKNLYLTSHDFHRIMSQVNWTDDNDLYLQKISMNIQVILLSNTFCIFFFVIVFQC